MGGLILQPNHPTATSGRFYFAGAQRVAIRTSTDLKFLLGDHLGSTSVTAYASGAFDTETRYYPWGGVRWAKCKGAGAYTHDARHVEFYYGAPFYVAGGNRSVSEASESNIHAVVHELGHAFAARFKDDSEINPYTMTENKKFNDGTSFLSDVGYRASPDPISARGYWRANLSTTKE